MAESIEAAELLLRALLLRHPGVARLLEQLGFSSISHTIRVYRGEPPNVSLADVYGLACLELGKSGIQRRTGTTVIPTGARAIRASLMC